MFTAEEEPNYSGLCVTVTMQTTGLSSGHLVTKVHDSPGRVMKQVKYNKGNILVVRSIVEQVIPSTASNTASERKLTNLSLAADKYRNQRTTHSTTCSKQLALQSPVSGPVSARSGLASFGRMQLQARFPLGTSLFFGLF